jgi:hypothetical protein
MTHGPRALGSGTYPSLKNDLRMGPGLARARAAGTQDARALLDDHEKQLLCEFRRSRQLLGSRERVAPLLGVSVGSLERYESFTSHQQIPARVMERLRVLAKEAA